MLCFTLVGNHDVYGEVIDNSQADELDEIALKNPEFVIIKQDNGRKLLINKNNILYIQQRQSLNK